MPCSPYQRALDSPPPDRSPQTRSPPPQPHPSNVNTPYTTVSPVYTQPNATPMHPSEIFNSLHGDYYTTSPSPPPTPPKYLPLRQRLVGAWRLESYVAYPTPTSPIQRAKFPMTKNVTGLIMYTPDGYMSAQMLIPGQAPIKTSAKTLGDDMPAWAEAGKRCFAYAGPYFITNDGPGREEVLRHTFQVCSLPGWIGDVQVRTWRFEEEGDVLVLGSEEPTEIKGDFRIPVLKWRRCRDNCGGSPPPPVPQIKVSGPGEW